MGKSESSDNAGRKHGIPRPRGPTNSSRAGLVRARTQTNCHWHKPENWQPRGLLFKPGRAGEAQAESSTWRQRPEIMRCMAPARKRAALAVRLQGNWHSRRFMHNCLGRSQTKTRSDRRYGPTAGRPVLTTLTSRPQKPCTWTGCS